MAFFPLVSFVALLLFGSVGSWASCGTQSNPYTITSPAELVEGGCGTGSYSLTATCSSMRSSGACNGLTAQRNNLFYTRFGYSSYFSKVESRNCQQSDVCFSGGVSATLACYSDYACDTKCEADSLACLQDPEATWDSHNCKCGWKIQTFQCGQFCDTCSRWQFCLPLNITVFG